MIEKKREEGMWLVRAEGSFRGGLPWFKRNVYAPCSVMLEACESDLDAISAQNFSLVPISGIPCLWMYSVRAVEENGPRVVF